MRFQKIPKAGSDLPGEDSRGGQIPGNEIDSKRPFLDGLLLLQLFAKH